MFFSPKMNSRSSKDSLRILKDFPEISREFTAVSASSWRLPIRKSVPLRDPSACDYRYRGARQDALKDALRRTRKSRKNRPFSDASRRFRLRNASKTTKTPIYIHIYVQIASGAVELLRKSLESLKKVL